MFLRSAADRLALGARATERVLRVGRTIADLDGNDRVTVAHLAEAFRYRVLDRQVAGASERLTP
jgi:magnesium chelatase family protein